MSTANLSRRGILGLFAAAPVAIALPTQAGSVAASPAQDWTTKPVEMWTDDDRRAEAEWHIDRAETRIGEIKGKAHEGAIVLSEPACPEACPVCTIGCAMANTSLNWWKRELASIAGQVPA